MNGDGHDREDLLRQSESVISGFELDDQGRAGAEVPFPGGPQWPVPERPHLRRPPRDGLALYRVRVDLDNARPPIWRRLDLRSDLTLDVVHLVLQSAFGWWDYHLHRFALGGGPFDAHSELFLCPFDVSEGEDDGTPEADVRLDEVVADRGDVLSYLYDYGDSWELTIRLEEVLPAEDGSPTAVCVDGRRAAPPEDCGGLTDGQDLAEVLDDPAHFDLDEINRSLREPHFVLRELGVPDRLVEIAYRLASTETGAALMARLLTLTTPVPEPSLEEKAAALAPFLWFLDRAGDEGFELTGAGYLKPVDVEAAAEVVPAMGDWIGKNNREANAAPLLGFRESLQKLGLLRKYKGRLLRTRAGKGVSGDPAALWDHLAGRLCSGRKGFDEEAGLLVLAYAATSTDGSVDLDEIAQTLSELGWVRSDGRPVGRYAVYGIEHDPFDVLDNVTDTPRGTFERHKLSPQAIALARQAIVGH